MFFVQMEAELMKKVRSVNRSWTPDSYFSLHKSIHRGGVRGKCPKGMSRHRNKGAQISCFVPGRRIPQLCHCMCWVDISPLLRPPTIIFDPGPMLSPSLKRIIVILSLGCCLKGSIVGDFLVCGLSGFLTYLSFAYIFHNSLYSKF